MAKDEAQAVAQAVIIMGAAGRDFHNFNAYFRDNGNHEIVAFTATQIPKIEGRIYPPSWPALRQAQDVAPATLMASPFIQKAS